MLLRLLSVSLPALAIGLPLLLLAGATLQAAEQASEGTGKTMEKRDTRSDLWSATDGLGRKLPGHAECGPPRAGKFVGIFYFLWMDKRHDNGHLYDNTKLRAANPDNPQYGPEGSFHYWGEPHMGYYLANDEFVIRKHAQMLSDAGVDVLFFDVTNAITYDEDYLAICRVFEEIRKTGRPTPQIAFLANSGSAKVVQHLYETFYAKNLYPDLWFHWKGKPLILTPPDGLTPEVRDFFTLRWSWAWSDPKGWFGDGKDRWPWLDHTPQQAGWHDDPKKPEEVSVCTAEHATSNIGRSFHAGKQPAPDQTASEKGLYFEEQWKRALEIDPEFIFITGWNEWIAQRFTTQGGGLFLGKPLKQGDTFFVDQYSQEFSRDIEPMRGGHGDAYYYQMVANIRRFKGVHPQPKVSAPRTLRIGSDFGQWETVGPEYLDDIGDTAHRNHPGWATAGPYVNKSGRNDFDRLKVARDQKTLYFYARTQSAITPLEEGRETNWMMLLLNTDGNAKTGWEGYDFAVRHVLRKGKVVSLLMRNSGGWKWETVAEVKMAMQGREMQLAIPRALLDLAPEKGALRLEFKWVDNVPNSGDILDFIDQGDVAPNGRFNYRYEEK